MTTTLALARPRVRQGLVKSGGDPSTYSDFDIDFSIRTFGSDFINRTRCTREVDSLDLFLNNPSVDFSSLATFNPDMLIEYSARVESEDWATATLSGSGVGSIAVNYSAIYTTTPTITFTNAPGDTGTGATATATLTNGRITAFSVTASGSGYTQPPTVLINGVANNYTANDVADGVEIVGMDQISESRRGSCTGTPNMLAFSDLATAQVFPTPKADGALSVCWSPPLVSFVPGTQGAYSSGANYYLGDVVSTGGSYYSCVQSNTNNAPASSPTYWALAGTGTPTAPSAVILNIPDHLIDGVLFWGAGYGLIAPATDISKGQGLMTSYQSHLDASRGRGGLGVKSIQRSLRR